MSLFISALIITTSLHKVVQKLLTLEMIGAVFMSFPFFLHIAEALVAL